MNHTGFLKWGYPQIIHLNRIFHYKPSILGYLWIRNPPYSGGSCRSCIVHPEEENKGHSPAALMGARPGIVNWKTTMFNQ